MTLYFYRNYNTVASFTPHTPVQTYLDKITCVHTRMMPDNKYTIIVRLTGKDYESLGAFYSPEIKKKHLQYRRPNEMQPENKYKT